MLVHLSFWIIYDLNFPIGALGVCLTEGALVPRYFLPGIPGNPYTFEWSGNAAQVEVDMDSSYAEIEDLSIQSNAGDSISIGSTQSYYQELAGAPAVPSTQSFEVSALPPQTSQESQGALTRSPLGSRATSTAALEAGPIYWEVVPPTPAVSPRINRMPGTPVTRATEFATPEPRQESSSYVTAAPVRAARPRILQALRPPNASSTGWLSSVDGPREARRPRPYQVLFRDEALFQDVIARLPEDQN
jgi:hypothetical protein